MRAKIIFLISSVVYGFNGFATPVDSIGVEKKGSKITVLHKVDEGQSLFSILKRYNSTFAEFYKANPTIKENQELKWQEVVKVPYHKTKAIPKKNSAEKAIVVENATKPIETPHGGKIDEDGIEVVDIPEATPKDTIIVASNQPKVVVSEEKTAVKPTSVLKTHTVVSGEHLFSIAQKYGVKTWQLRQWNNLPNDILKIGQKLTVEKPAKLPATQSKAPTTPKPVIAAKKDTSKTVIQGPAGEASKPKVTSKTPAVVKSNQPVPNAPGGKKINEQGIAEVMEGGEQTTKFLAFHKTAPIGTLVIVKNEANGQSVWVKVIGKLTGSTDAVVKISPKAFERLQSKDRRIRVSTTYTVAN